MNFVSYIVIRYDQLLVPLSLGESDEGTIRWAGKIARLAGSSAVHFFHSKEMPEIPETVMKKYPWLMEPLDGMLEKRMREVVEANWKGPAETDVDYAIKDDKGEIFGILGTIIDLDIDLVITGRKEMERDLPVQLARKSTCSVMSVPKGEGTSITKIIVPTDFSEYSKEALDVAIAFAVAEGIKEIESLHISGAKGITSRTELAKESGTKMLELATQEAHEEYLSGIDDRGIKLIAKNINSKLISGTVFKRVNDTHADLIVTGCRGRDTVTSFLLGSNAEMMLKYATIPVIAAKKKGTGQKLLQALLDS